MARLGGDALASALGGLSKYRRPCRAAAKLDDDTTMTGEAMMTHRLRLKKMKNDDTQSRCFLSLLYSWATPATKDRCPIPILVQPGLFGQMPSQGHVSNNSTISTPSVPCIFPFFTMSFTVQAVDVALAAVALWLLKRPSRRSSLVIQSYVPRICRSSAIFLMSLPQP